MRFFFGVHSIPTGLVGAGIRATTEAHVQPPWILGPAHAATHAFVAWGHGSERITYRLDGMQPRSKLSIWTQPEVPTALWELLKGQEKAWRKAVSLVGKPYDEVEALAQLFPFIGRMELWDGGSICTGFCMEVLRAVGERGEQIVNGLPNRLPEAFGHAMDKAFPMLPIVRVPT